MTDTPTGADNPEATPKDEMMSRVVSEIYKEQERMGALLKRTTRDVAYSGRPEIDIAIGEDNTTYSMRLDPDRPEDVWWTGFVVHNEGVNSEAANHFGLTSPYELNFDGHKEVATTDAFSAYAKEDPHVYYGAMTIYVVGLDGNGKYKMVKAVRLPNQMINNDRVVVPISTKSEKMKFVESPVEPGDYELVGNTSRRIHKHLIGFHLKTDNVYLK